MPGWLNKRKVTFFLAFNTKWWVDQKTLGSKSHSDILLFAKTCEKDRNKCESENKIWETPFFFWKFYLFTDIFGQRKSIIYQFKNMRSCIHIPPSPPLLEDFLDTCFFLIEYAEMIVFSRQFRIWRSFCLFVFFSADNVKWFNVVKIFRFKEIIKCDSMMNNNVKWHLWIIYKHNAVIYYSLELEKFIFTTTCKTQVLAFKMSSYFVAFPLAKVPRMKKSINLTRWLCTLTQMKRCIRVYSVCYYTKQYIQTNPATVTAKGYL